MAEFPIEALNELERGEQYFSNLKEEYLNDLKLGCDCCYPDSFELLRTTIKALQYKRDLEQYDSVAIENIDIMLKIIGGYVLVVSPSVDAGLDQSQPIGDTVVFTATITEGSSPISSILWTQISGSEATLSGVDTNVLTVSNYGLGAFVFKIMVTDGNGLSASDTVQLTGLSDDNVIAYWGTKASTGTLTRTQILAGQQINYNAGASFIIPVNMGSPLVLWFAYLSTEPTKTYYEDTVNPLNKGWMLSDQDYIGAPVIVSEFKYQEAYYPLQQVNPLEISTQ